jgi:hypothetical protein
MEPACLPAGTLPLARLWSIGPGSSYPRPALAGDNPTDHILQESIPRNHDAMIFQVLEYLT